MDPFSLESYRYDVPSELVAQFPMEPRDQARLLIVHRDSRSIEEALVRDLPSFLHSDDALIFNNTRVLHAALKGRLEDNRCIDVLLTEKVSPRRWWAMAKPAKKLLLHTIITFGEEGDLPLCARVIDVREDGQRLLEFSSDVTEGKLRRIGRVPLPPYIKRASRNDLDAKRYQTIYAQKPGSVAAPTAGLHFTDALFARLDEKRVSRIFVTLHVGTGTFLPVRTEDIRHHTMHEEFFSLPQEIADTLNGIPSTARRIAVGTTSCRVLETAADESGLIHAKSGGTNLFIYPGYTWRFVNGLFTNFHTPESSLLMLVGAFMGYDLLREAYAEAIKRGFRLFSYGDAMLIL